MNPIRTEPMFPYIFWFIGAISISGLGFLAWLFLRKGKIILDKKPADLQRENEFELLKQELQKETQLLENEINAHKVAQGKLEDEINARRIVEEKLLQKEDEVTGLKDSLRSLNEARLQKETVKELPPAEKEVEPWMPKKRPERRQHPRVDVSDLTIELTRDYNRTIKLRVETQDESQCISVFAGNISLGGLSFESTGKFNIGDRLNLRLFFYGDMVPNMKITAEVAWKKEAPPVYRYGVSFISLEEKNKETLARYIESKMNAEV